MPKDATPPLTEKARLQRRTPAERANDAPKNVKLAIAAFCYRCQNDGEGGPHTIRAMVRDCKHTDCELWRHRGWQNSTTGKTWMPGTPFPE